MGREDEYFWKTSKKNVKLKKKNKPKICTNHKRVVLLTHNKYEKRAKMATEHDFWTIWAIISIKMLREISNDDLTPKKKDSIDENEFFENESNPEPLYE